VSCNQIAVEPQFSLIQQECHAGFDRLHAEVLLPIVQDATVVGGLAVGPGAAGAVFEAPERAALSTAVQHAVQAIRRVEATDRLRARESMIHSVPTVQPSCSLSEAARMLLDFERACLPVVSESVSGPVLIGLLTQSDLLRAAYADG